MLRDIITILKRYLHEGYDDYQTEISYVGPWEVLADYPDNRKIRVLAREIITAIRGIKDIDLVRAPSEEEAAKFLKTIFPIYMSDAFKDALDASWDEYAKIHAKCLVEWVRSL